MYETPINNGKNYLSTGAGFQPSTVSQSSSAEESESVAAATKKSQRMSGAVPLFTPFSKASIAIHLMRFQTSLRTGF